MKSFKLIMILVAIFMGANIWAASQECLQGGDHTFPFSREFDKTREFDFYLFDHKRMEVWSFQYFGNDGTYYVETVQYNQPTQTGVAMYQQGEIFGEIRTTPTPLKFEVDFDLGLIRVDDGISCRTNNFEFRKSKALHPKNN